MGDNSAVSQSTAPKKTIPCEECGKPLSSKQSLTNHVLKIHRKVEETSRSPLVQTTSSALTSAHAPAPPSTPAPPSLPGPFSAATPTAATMATPASLTSSGTLSASSTAPSPVPNPTPKQIDFVAEVETDLQTEEEVLREALEEEAIYELLENLAESEFNPNTAKEIKEKTKEKLVRYRTIMSKKTDLQKKAEQKVKQLEVQLAQVKHDAVLQEEIIENKNITLDEKEKEIDDIRKEMKKTEDMQEKGQQENEINLQKIIQENGELVKQNQDLKFVIDNQKALIVAMKKKTGSDDVQEEEPEVVVTARVVMDKEASTHKCTACDKIFNRNEDLERHMNAKHSEQQCILCEKVCSSERELIRHQAQCVDQGVETVTCNKCKTNYTNIGIKRHTQLCH